MNLRLVGVNQAVGTDVEISSADFNISDFYGKKQQKLVIPLNGDHFQLAVKISVIDVIDGPLIDVNVAGVIECASPARTKLIDENTRMSIKHQTDKNERKKIEQKNMGKSQVYVQSSFEQEQLQYEMQKLREENNLLKKGSGGDIIEWKNRAEAAELAMQKLAIEVQEKDEEIQELEKEIEHDQKIADQ